MCSSVQLCKTALLLHPCFSADVILDAGELSQLWHCPPVSAKEAEVPWQEVEGLPLASIIVAEMLLHVGDQLPVDCDTLLYSCQSAAHLGCHIDQTHLKLAHRFAPHARVPDSTLMTTQTCSNAPL